MPGHLMMEERDRIAQLRHQIARALGCRRSTISRELQRNHVGNECYAARVRRRADYRHLQRQLSRKMDAPQLNRAVRAGLAQG